MYIYNNIVHNVVIKKLSLNFVCGIPVTAKMSDVEEFCEKWLNVDSRIAMTPVKKISKKPIKVTPWTKNPWKFYELIHGKFTGFSKDVMPPWKKHEKNIKKAIKNPLIFQFSWAMKTLTVWTKPWNTNENIIKILVCFSWLFNDIENAMNYKEGFSWCCSSWSFHEASEFMAHEKPMVIPLPLKD